MVRLSQNAHRLGDLQCPWTMLGRLAPCRSRAEHTIWHGLQSLSVFGGWMGG